MNELVLVIENVNDFLELNGGDAGCWFKIDFLGDKALLSIFCESVSKIGGFVIYRFRRFLDNKILINLERIYNVDFGEGCFEDRVYIACMFIFENFINDLKDLGINVHKGRYFIGLRPIFRES